MDYLVVEGYKEAADCFARESGVAPVDLESIEHRMAIRAAIQRGDVEDAIGRVNDLDPDVRRDSRLSRAEIINIMHHAERSRKRSRTCWLAVRTTDYRYMSARMMLSTSRADAALRSSTATRRSSSISSSSA